MVVFRPISVGGEVYGLVIRPHECWFIAPKIGKAGTKPYVETGIGIVGLYHVMLTSYVQGTNSWQPKQRKEKP